MTPKHEMFVLNYIESMNATDAYAKAYPKASRKTAESNGFKLLQRADVKAAIDQRMNEIKSSKIASATDVLEFLTEVMYTKKNYMKDRIHAAELLGKSHAAFTDKVKTEGNLEINIMVDTDDSE